ncbi:DUF6884 domain-containing protein [Paenibacillus rigui]|uniref:DUF6884 domain-containing protein n=1 Tax=Paenibacillus rigui TaxID=554312 RepID=A0A229UUN5_9BACL|nr:DUF6884 domain-containing protein [Paenibacillus rigui]OXM87236.1 hypothetical protein CF651_06210 [Paenibacillus rigui]
MNRLCIIPCGSRKIWDTSLSAEGSYPARQTYTGALHRKCQAYAARFFEEWSILSAKHGFLLPDDEVPGNYNVAFGSKHPNILSVEELSRQARMRQWERMDEIVVLGGKKFTALIPLVFPEAGRIVYPLVGSKGIGYMLQSLDRALASDKEFPA